MPTLSNISFGAAAHVKSYGAAPEFLVLCEHASNRVPGDLQKLGLSDDVLQSHVAWDPGAEPVAHHLAAKLGACCVTGGISRLVYDCNRPPEAESAVPAVSEIHSIPGNANLSTESKRQRVEGVYVPFCQTVQAQVTSLRPSLKLLVTIHSFNPIYNSKPREVELGVLHGKDPSFAQAMMRDVPDDIPYLTRLNAPYSAADGVAHSLDIHGTAHGLPNVMIEIRNDLIATQSEQKIGRAHV